MPSIAPIRIDVESDGVRFLDTFVIDLDQATDIITPDGVIFEEYIADLICRDFNLISSTFKQQIALSIRLQCEDYLRFKCIIPGPSLMLLIKLDIIAAGVHLIDQFEWILNTNEGDNTDAPERYAKVFVTELGLDSEFVSAISHSIREQCHWARKALITNGYDGIENVQIPYELLGLLSINTKPLELRPEQDWDLFSPKITKIEESTLSVFHPTAQERESRRLRRQMRSKGVSGTGLSLGIFGMDSSWPSSFKVIRSPYPPQLDNLHLSSN